MNYHALPAVGYLAALIWILSEITELAESHAAPIYAHLATALWALFPLLVGGTLHMALVKDDLLRALAQPIHRKWFGHSKTWRGVLAMSLFTIVGAYWLQSLFGIALLNGTFDFHRLTPAPLGLILGATFVLAELPNSFVKRRMGIAPGEPARRYRLVFIIGDQLDSLIACGLVYVIALDMPWTTFVAFLTVGVLFLLLTKRCLFHLGMRKSPT